MIRFDDGTTSYFLGSRLEGVAERLPDREARLVLARWLSSEPGHTQLRTYAEREIRVEARTDDALIDRVCALMDARGLRLGRTQRTGQTELIEIGETEQAEPLVAAQVQDQAYFIRVVVVDTEGRPVARARYRIKLTDGRVQEDWTDADGALHYDEIPGGECTFSLIEYDESAWAVTT